MGIMSSNLQVEALLQRLASKLPDSDVVVEVDQSAVRLWIRGTLPPKRIASIARIDGSMYAVELDHLYQAAWIDEDLSTAEEEERLKSLLAIGEEYVKSGGETGRTRFTGTPYIEVQVSGKPVRVFRPFGWQRGSSLSPWERPGL